MEIAQEIAVEHKVEAKPGDSWKRATEQQWEEIKIASIAGVEDAELAEKYEVTRETIRFRRHKDPMWAEAVKARRELVNRKQTEGSGTALLAKKAASTIAESHQSLSLSNRLLASQIAAKALQRGSGAIDSLEVENFGDLEKIVKIAALAGGWNQPQVNVAQSFAFGGSDNSLECVSEIVQSEAITDEFT